MTEHEHQVALFRWAGLQRHKYPELDLLFAIPNGGHRHVLTASKLKAEGVRAGIPDICLPVARNGYHALYLELKRPNTGRVSPLQEEWHIKLCAAGNRVAVCHGWESAVQTIENYLSENA